MKANTVFALLIVLVFNSAGSAQFAITIDAQKDAFYEQLAEPVDGHIFIPHSDFLPLSGPKPDGDTDLSLLYRLGKVGPSKAEEEALIERNPRCIVLPVKNGKTASRSTMILLLLC